MTDQAKNKTCDLGVIGLGVMGSNFALNVADHGFSVAGYNRKEEKIRQLSEIKSERHKIETTREIRQLCQMLRTPRAIVLLVPAGPPVDAVIESLVPHLEHGDLIIDSGNSHFTDTDRRGAALKEKGLLFMGMGMSGGESDARRGPSLMPGGPEQGYARVRPILEAVAAHVGATPCVAYLGPGSAGHYVKMVHNGIEYGVMQLIAESYDLMKRGLGLHPDELHRVYSRWNRRALSSYLMEITADIFLQKDARTGQPLIDLILDAAKQKGTGEWTVADALQVQVPTLNIDAAVMMRHMSGAKAQRQAAAQQLKGPGAAFAGDKQPFIDRLENALYAAVIMTYAQGMALLKQASATYGYRLNLETVARVWTGGCIIRATLLTEVQAAYKADPRLDNLLVAPQLGPTLMTLQADLRAAIRVAVDLGVPVPGLMMALAYWDAYRSNRLPANLIMAQRDYFGSHTYERVDAEGTFHTQWGRKE